VKGDFWQEVTVEDVVENKKHTTEDPLEKIQTWTPDL
jgi:hypothetical protein